MALSFLKNQYALRGLPATTGRVDQLWKKLGCWQPSTLLIGEVELTSAMSLKNHLE